VASGRQLRRRFTVATAALVLCLSASPAVQADNLLPFCGSCQIQIGVGETYHFWVRTGGVVVPLTLVWDGNRYEVSVFRMSTSQALETAGRPPDHIEARPYWASTLSRRWQVGHFWSTRVFFGFGGAYKSAVDGLNSTHWNFAESLGARFQVTSGGSAVELCIRHWSNAGLRLPNRGQDFVTVSYVF
jgi:hypothetical protein